ncbi:hypothetical protein BH23BAC4_BH23BAC4_12940 [soil metagenome]
MQVSKPDILILVGTQTGNSELIADDVAEHLGDRGYSCHVLDMADAFPETLLDFEQLLVVMCTWAEGTPPDNAKDFFLAFNDVAPDLTGLSFGIIGLGDHDYDPYFCTASRDLGETLERLGAVRAREDLELEGVPKQVHFARARDWSERLAEALTSSAHQG